MSVSLINAQGGYCERKTLVTAFLAARIDPVHKELFGGSSNYRTLGFYEVVVDKGPYTENRISFDLASVELTAMVESILESKDPRAARMLWL